jgi:hypothetical protein
MTKTELSSRAISTLAGKGWDGTQRNIDRDLADLREEGFDSPLNCAIFFLEQYSGIEFETIDLELSRRSIISLGVDKALEIPCLKLDINEHQMILGKNLYPVGSMDLYRLDSDNKYERMVLLIADDGGIYSSRSYVICQEGYDGNDFINRVIDGQGLWKTHEELRINYSKSDPKLKASTVFPR